MTSKIKIFGLNFSHFDRFEGSFLTIVGVEKGVFWTFSKLLRSCLANVLALSLVL